MAEVRARKQRRNGCYQHHQANVRFMHRLILVHRCVVGNIDHLSGAVFIYDAALDMDKASHLF